MFECQMCNFSTSRLYDLKRHNQSKRHITIEHLKSQTIDQNSDHNIKKTIISLNNDSFFDTNKPSINITDNAILKSMMTNELQLGTNINKNIYSNDDLLNALDKTIIINDQEKRPKKKVHLCECGKVFSHSGNLSRHRKTCDGKPKKIENLKIIEKDTYIIKLETELAEVKKQLEQSKFAHTSIANNSHNTYSTNISDNKICSDNNVNNIVNNNKISVFAYLDTHYNEAPAIKMLESDDITRILANCELGKHLLEDLIVFQHSKYSLHRFLGEFILKEFKKSDPKKQQFWIADIPRLKFAVRQALNQNDLIWRPDAKGVCLTNHIITPILNEIFSMMTEYKDLCKERVKDAQTSEQHEKIHNQSTNALGVIYDINQKILHKKILTYIAPYFQLELIEHDLLN